MGGSGLDALAPENETMQPRLSPGHGGGHLPAAPLPLLRSACGPRLWALLLFAAAAAAHCRHLMAPQARNLLLKLWHLACTTLVTHRAGCPTATSCRYHKLVATAAVVAARRHLLRPIEGVWGRAV